MAGLYAADLLAVIVTVLISIDALAGEIASGSIQAIASKPIARREIVLGKWLGFVAMLTLYLALMMGGVVLVSYAEGRVLPHHAWRGAGLIWLECVLVLSLTLLFSSTFSTLSSGVLTLGLHGLAFLAGWIEQLGAVLNSRTTVNVGIAASLIMPSESLWRRAVFEMQSPVLGVLQFSPFSNVAVPSGYMVMYGGVYLVVALALAARRFSRRDL